MRADPPPTTVERLGDAVGIVRCDRCGHPVRLHDERGCPMLDCRCPLRPPTAATEDELVTRMRWGDR